MIPARFCSTIDALGLDQKAWNDLAAGSATNSIFQTYQWVSSWEKVFGDQYEPWFISAGEPAGVVGVAPLMVKQGFRGERRVMFLGDGKADYCDFLTTGDRGRVLEAMCNALFAARDRWDVIELNNIPAGSSTVELVQEVSLRAGYRTLQRTLYQSPTLLISGHEDEALRVFNKPGLRRRQNYFERNGRLTITHLTGAAVLPHLDGLFDQHVMRWADSGTPSLFLKDSNRTFYRELARAMADKGWVLLSVVEFDDRPLAMHFGFDYNGRVLWYKPSFDRAHAKHSPGLVLLRYLIGYALDHKREEFDFTIGDEPFKSRFSNHVRKTVSLEIFRDPARYYLAWSTQTLSAAKKRLL
ncbi:GNAT family N-acetyltransferase [Nitrospira sp. NS4]|uniref:GNAT family N-acetyltransferase n=1 Tax=Nitrospira sp. NS4 TaxID=3414498 RepID=UPI003C2C06A9